MHITRRTLLIGSGWAGVVGALSAGGHWWGVEQHLAAKGLRPDSTGSASDGVVLVLITLYGGNDGLSTVVPAADPAYHSARGSAALDASTLLPLADGFFMHPAMKGFKQLWSRGELAVVHGVGYPNPSYSHFESMAIWQSAMVPDGGSSGWLGRWLDLGTHDPLRALSIGPTVPLALVGTTMQGSALPPPPMSLPGTRALQSAYATMQSASCAGSEAQSSMVSAVAASGADLLTVDSDLAPIVGSPTPASPDAGSALAITQGGGGQSSPTVLSQQLGLVAELVKAGVPTSVYAVSFGGFDTHTDQASTQQRLLGQLDEGVFGFLTQMSPPPHGRPVVVVIHTEFGRRVAGNASGGTDHGSANVVFVAGSVVKGGFYGHPPSLTNLDDGNLVFTTDFRSVYASLLGPVLGVDPAKVLGGTYPAISLLR